MLTRRAPFVPGDSGQTWTLPWRPKNLLWAVLYVACGIFLGVSIPRICAQPANRTIVDEERELGVFAVPAWFPDGMAQDVAATYMTPYWSNAEFQARGVNYWTVGWPSKGMDSSSRFDPDSKFYQAWAGVYVARSDSFVHIGNSRSLPIQEIGQLAELDQKAWLASYGDPNPKAKVIQWTPSKETSVDGRRAFVFYGEISSHSDVSEIGTKYSESMARSFRALQLDGSASKSFFTPKPRAWEGKVSRFHELLLRGYFVIVPITDKGTVVCIYANGARFRKLDGTVKDTFDSLEASFQKYISAVKIKVAL
jgi:hypothetical protein